MTTETGNHARREVSIVLIPVRTMKRGKLRYKNTLYIEDMRVMKSENGPFVILLSTRDGKSYVFDHLYDGYEDAENKMREIAEQSNLSDEW